MFYAFLFIRVMCLNLCTHVQLLLIRPLFTLTSLLQTIFDKKRRVASSPSDPYHLIWTQALPQVVARGLFSTALLLHYQLGEILSRQTFEKPTKSSCVLYLCNHLHELHAVADVVAGLLWLS